MMVMSLGVRAQGAADVVGINQAASIHGNVADFASHRFQMLGTSSGPHDARWLNWIMWSPARVNPEIARLSPSVPPLVKTTSEWPGN